MKQSSLPLGASTKRTRRRKFLEEMDRVVPWSELVALIAPYLPEGKRGHPPFTSLASLDLLPRRKTMSACALY